MVTNRNNLNRLAVSNMLIGGLRGRDGAMLAELANAGGTIKLFDIVERGLDEPGMRMRPVCMCGN